MATKLNWSYDQTVSEKRAELRGYRIRMVQDTCPSNPFEENDGNWPIAVHVGGNGSGNLTEYPKNAELLRPISDFTDEGIVFSQHHIAKLFTGSVDSMMCEFADAAGVDPVKHCTDADVLRDVFTAALDDLDPGSNKFDTVAELYKLAGIPAYSGQATGYCQGDYSYVLVVATKAKREEFGCTEVTDTDLEKTVDLYGNWAFGNVYGYVVERPIEWDEDGDPEEWEEVASCWGFYGDEDESGLDEQAFDDVPDEPVNAPTPDAIVHALMELA